jgi:phospholipase/carboxylesterase
VITRRKFNLLTGSALISAALGSCRSQTESRIANDGRLTSRPRSNVETSLSGEQTLGLDHARDAILKLPTKLSRAPLPLIVILHGAGQSAEWMLGRVASQADDAGVAVLSPYSRESSWDAVHGSFGPDVTFLNRALERVFDSVAVDPTRIAIGGFSDGATYAISLGLINGDIFNRVIAFSPGFVVDGSTNGNPVFFISHGTEDPILPIDRCGRRIVKGLTQRGYSVTFREFEGKHEVPANIAQEAMGWLAGKPVAACSVLYE